MNEQKTTALMYEMLRSFIVVAEELNITRAVARLVTTRQTVKRHIKALEVYRGAPLFIVEGRQYALTPAGRAALESARDAVLRIEAWMKNQLGHSNGLDWFRGRSPEAIYYNLQEHPVGSVWSNGPQLFAQAIAAWANARGRLEDPAFMAIRPYVVAFRKVGSEWVCVEVGAKSAYASWFGWDWARSSVGLISGELPGGTTFGRFLIEPYEDVSRTDGLRLDHIVTDLPRDQGEEAQPISYQRLLMGCRFADDSRGLVSVVVRTWNIVIDGLDRTEVERMPRDLCME